VHHITIIIKNPSLSKFKEDINNIIDNINNYFRENSLSLNFDKNYFLQFRPVDSFEINIKINCNNKLIKGTKNSIFLGIDRIQIVPCHGNPYGANDDLTKQSMLCN